MWFRASNPTQKDVFLIGLFSASAAPSVSAANGLSRRSNLHWRVQIQQSATLTRRQVCRHGCREHQFSQRSYWNCIDIHVEPRERADYSVCVDVLGFEVEFILVLWV